MQQIQNIFGGWWLHSNNIIKICLFIFSDYLSIAIISTFKLESNKSFSFSYIIYFNAHLFQESKFSFIILNSQRSLNTLNSNSFEIKFNSQLIKKLEWRLRFWVKHDKLQVEVCSRKILKLKVNINTLESLKCKYLLRKISRIMINCKELKRKYDGDHKIKILWISSWYRNWKY